MRLTDTIYRSLLLASLSFAGPVRRDAIRKFEARSFNFSNTSTPTSASSLTIQSGPMTIIPVDASTTTSSVETTSSSSSHSSQNLPPSGFVPTTQSAISSSSTRSGSLSPASSASANDASTTMSPRPSVSPFLQTSDAASNLVPVTASPTVTVPRASFSKAPSSVSSTSQSAVTISSIAAGGSGGASLSVVSSSTSIAGIRNSTSSSSSLITVTSSSAAASSPLSSSSFSIPRFTLNDTSQISLPTMSASAGFQQPAAPSTTLITIDPSKFSTVSISATVLTTSSISAPSRTSASQTITKIPTVINSLPASTATVSPTELNANLAEAVNYNNLFSQLNFSSPCTGGDIACIAGNVAKCNTAGNFAIEKCTSGTQCFAMPMNNTKGVFVGCTDINAANAVLGSDSPATSSAASTLSSSSTSQVLATTSSTRGQASQTTLPLINPSPTTSKLTPDLTSSTTLTISPTTTSSIIPPPPPPARTEPTSSSSEAELTTTTTIAQKSTITVVVTRPTPNAAVPTPKQTPAGDGGMLTIIPVTAPAPTIGPQRNGSGDGDGNGDGEAREKETVTVTATVTTTATERIRG